MRLASKDEHRKCARNNSEHEQTHKPSPDTTEFTHRRVHQPRAERQDSRDRAEYDRYRELNDSSLRHNHSKGCGFGLTALSMVNDLVRSFLAGAVRAAVERAVRLDAVPDDLAAASVADGRELVDRALEAIERVPRARRNDFKGQIVIISAYFTLCHSRYASSLQSPQQARAVAAGL